VLCTDIWILDCLISLFQTQNKTIMPLHLFKACTHATKTKVVMIKVSLLQCKCIQKRERRNNDNSNFANFCETDYTEVKAANTTTQQEAKKREIHGK